MMFLGCGAGLDPNVTSKPADPKPMRIPRGVAERERADASGEPWDQQPFFMRGRPRGAEAVAGPIGSFETGETDCLG